MFVLCVCLYRESRKLNKIYKNVLRVAVNSSLSDTTLLLSDHEPQFKSVKPHHAIQQLQKQLSTHFNRHNAHHCNPVKPRKTAIVPHALYKMHGV